MVAQIVVGLLVSAVGGVIIYYSYQIVEVFGRSAWAESNLGGTRNMYVLAGFFMVIIGFLIMFGVIPLSNPVETATSM